MSIQEKYEEEAYEILMSGLSTFLSHPFDVDTDLKHMARLGASVMLTRDDILHGGGFVTSVVKNDLYGAICRADGTAIQGLKYFLHLREYVHFTKDGKVIK